MSRSRTPRRATLGLDRVVVVVVADPGHKDVHARRRRGSSSRGSRFPGREVVLDHHARTVDMLRDGSWDDPVFLIGADEFLDFSELEGARDGARARPARGRHPSRVRRCRRRPPDRVLFFEIEPVPVSSREIREMVARGEPIDGLVPPAVAAAIAEKALYRG